MSTNSGTQVTGFPNASEPFVEIETGVMTRPWQRFLANLWNKAGGGTALSNAVYLTLVSGAVEAFVAVSGKLVGKLALLGQAGQPAVSQVLTVSPFVFKSTVSGTLVVESGQVELSRNSGANWFVCSLTGGAIPVLNADWVRVTWYNSAPLVTLFPS